MPPLRVLIAGGGTGGHLFPGMAIAEALGQQGPVEIRFVGTSHGIEAQVIPKRGWVLYCLPVSGLYRVGLFKKLISLSKLPVALIQSIFVLLSYRPQVVVGVGGYASGPILLMALLLGFNTVLQEQNAYPGMTNRLLGKYVPLSFVPFAGLEAIFKNPIVVGNPVRKEIQEGALQVYERPDSPFTVVVVGGSQGARVLNQAMVGALSFLKNHQIRILHQTGVADFESVQQSYVAFPELQAEVTPFVETMAQWYQQAHVVVSRAGSVVMEICAMGRASILVPIPNASGEHQQKNALAMEQGGAAILLEQRMLTPEKLVEQILVLKEDITMRRGMEEAAREMYPGDAAQTIAFQIRRFYHLGD